MKYNKHTYILFVFLLISLSIKSQIKVTTERFTDQNGLSQNTITSILKDKDGFIWFATKDGISRYDGYSFNNFKISSKEYNCSLNNQFIQMLQDERRNLWLCNTMGQVFRFNTYTHKFGIYPNPQTNRGENYIYIKKNILINKNDIWLIGESSGAIRIQQKGNSIIQTRLIKNNKLYKNKVNNVYKDTKGIVWIMSDNGLSIIGDVDKQIKAEFFKNISFTSCVEYNHTLFFSTNQNCIISFDITHKRFSAKRIRIQNQNNIFLYSNKKLLITTGNNGIAILDLSSKINKYVHQDNQGKPLNITKAWQDKFGDIWIKNKNNNGIERLDIKNLQLFHLNAELTNETLENCYNSNQFQFAFFDDNNKLWNIPALTTNQWYKTSYTGEKPIIKNNSYKLCLMMPQSYGIYWTTAFLNGVQKNVLLSSSLQFYQNEINNNYTENNDITSLCQDNLQRLWLATKDKCIRINNANHSFIGYLQPNGIISKNKETFDDYASVIYQDKHNNIWLGIGTKLLKLTATSSSFKSFIVKQYALPVKSQNSLFITDILQDSKNRIWITTNGDGIQLLNENKEKYYFSNRHNDLKYSYPPTVIKTNCLFEDNRGLIWMGSSEGITIFPVDFFQNKYLKFFFYNPENSDIETSYISKIFQDKEGVMWLASFGGGVIKISKNFELGDSPNIKMYSTNNNNLSSDLVLSLSEDNKGYLWFLTENALLKFNPKTEESESFGVVNGLNHIGFTQNAFGKTRKGNLIIGTNGGFYDFDPYKIQKTNFTPKIVFTHFYLFNKEIIPSSSNSILKGDINDLPNIILEHDQTDFSIEFSALDFRNSSQIKYAYKLNEFEKEWNYVGNKHIASFTNLQPGNYQLIIKSTNSEGNWCNNYRTISITIEPSFWQTIFAKILFIIIIGSIIGGIVYIYLTFYKMKTDMYIEHNMSQMKLEFFTNISHEIRTPLTLINAPIEKVLSSKNLSEEDRSSLVIVRNNSERMLRLLNQILDFRKIQTNNMHLRIEQINMTDLIEKCCENFKKMAEIRNIDFKYIDKTNSATLWVDKDKIDTVMYNLLSNAFKFTLENKKIRVFSELDLNGNYCLSVVDEGCGIPKEKTSVIFDRFITLKNKSYTNQGGTGIGLSLVKEIVNLHKGFITINSEINVGTTITIHLQKGFKHFGEDVDRVVNDNSLSYNTDIIKQQETNKITPINDVKILVVEDNDDMRNFIQSILSHSYNVIVAKNGLEGLELTEKELPDFILSDIMMPIMDGVTFVKKVRANNMISHIPIILLTAIADFQNKMECLNIGANDYITKPFSIDYLQLRIRNILEDRKKWQTAYKNKIINKTPSIEEGKKTQDNSDSTSVNDELLKKVVAYINANISDSELSIDQIANELKISRWTLSSKIKGLMGQTPIEFIKEIKLNKAITLLNNKDINISQVSYMIGINDSRYFSRIFKQKYGLTPTEYRNNLK